MSLRERFYSILIVSATDSFTSAFADLLPETRYYPIHNVTSVSAAKRALAEKTFDFVIINAPLPDDVGTRFAIDTCNLKLEAASLHAVDITKLSAGYYTLVYQAKGMEIREKFIKY